MTPWQIIGLILTGLVALIFLFLFAPVSLTLIVNDKHGLLLRGRVLGLSFYRYPEKEEPVCLSDYDHRTEKQSADGKSQKKQVTPPPPREDAPLTEKLSFAADLASSIVRRSLSMAHVFVKRLAISVGSEDAATTAILYGTISPALAFLLEALEQFSHLHISRRSAVGVAADFTSNRIRADIHLRFRLRVFQVIRIALHAAIKTAKHQSQVSKRKAK